MERRSWSRNELFETLQLYCLIPFGRIHSRNPQIRELASKISRTASAVALKMVNFASLDPTLSQRGMSNASRLDRQVWDEFFSDMMESLEQSPSAKSAAAFAEGSTDYLLERTTFPEGTDVVRLVKTRVNQDFFRRLVLASYDNRCALTGIEAPELLVASHIVPWSVQRDIRTTPCNGICLNSLHDRAFDEGYLTFADDLGVMYSRDLPTVARQSLESFGSRQLRPPSRFAPDKSMLAFHREEALRRRRF
jgi:putative restriction endonuclease